MQLKHKYNKNNILTSKKSGINPTFCVVELFGSVRFVGEQSHLSCSLDSDCQGALMLCANAAHTTGKDLTFLGGEPSELAGFLVVDVIHMLYAEGAYFLFGRSLSGARGFYFVCHINIYSLIKMEDPHRWA